MKQNPVLHIGLISAFFLISALPIASQCIPESHMLGESGNNYFGEVVAGGCDINNDGFDDYVIGAPGYGTNTGRVYVFSGFNGDTLWVFTGEAARDYFGHSVDIAGDVNNDNYCDIVVGARGTNSTDDNPGAAYVYSGLDGSLIYKFTGESAGDLFGWSVAGLGDINGDGFADMLVGAESNDAAGTNAGRAYVYSGFDGSVMHVFTGEAGYDHFGVTVNAVGDINGDGFNDLGIAANGSDAGAPEGGRSYVFSGIDGDTLQVFTGSISHQYYGVHMDGLGDINGDGFGDIVLYAGRHDTASTGSSPDSLRVFVIGGMTGDTLLILGQSTEMRFFGSPVCAVGDVNGDGYSDIAVAADGGLRYDLGISYAYLDDIYIYSSIDGQLLQEFTNFGLSLSSAGDFDNDGIDDLIIGNRGSSAAGSMAGQAYLFSLGEACESCCVGIRGDFDGDQIINILDINSFVNYLFNQSLTPACLEEADANDDSGIDITDLLILVDYLFNSGFPPLPCQ